MTKSNNNDIYVYDGFNSLPSQGFIGQDLSREYEQTYKVLKPFARDEKGNFLNDSEFEKLIPGDKVNIQERIDSYFEECDLYSILAKCSRVEDYINYSYKQGLNADLSSLPHNYNDMFTYYKDLQNRLNVVPIDIKNMIINGASDSDIKSYLDTKKNNVNVPKNDDTKNNNSEVK